MNPFQYRDGQLFAEQVPVSKIAIEHGTPTYVYSRAALVQAYREFADVKISQPLTVCYAIKANSNLGVLNCLAREGAGFDIVSAGELQRVLAAGGDAQNIVFSGVGKNAAEMAQALEAGVRCFNVESESELRLLSQVASATNKQAPISIRVNPNVDAKTHPYISTGLRENKFGIAHEEALATYQLAAKLPGIKVIGIDCHIGSQITEMAPFLAALDRIVELIQSLQQHNIELEHIDLGGGLGVSYEDHDDPPARGALISAISERMTEQLGPTASRYELVFEFGRSICASAGILLTQVQYLKPTAEKNFAIVDAAMNDLLRPTLYQAVHRILPVRPRTQNIQTWDLVGPICESGDWLAKNSQLDLSEGDLLAFGEAGAYGMAMSSNYNARPRAAELMVDGSQVHVVRERESIADLFSHERLLPD